MASPEESHYRVTPTPPAERQIADLAAQAASPSERQRIMDAWDAIFEQLKTRPLDWGDPEYRTHKEGGWVYHGISSPLIARYAAFEAEKVVFLFNVRALSGSPPAG